MPQSKDLALAAAAPAGFLARLVRDWGARFVTLGLLLISMWLNAHLVGRILRERSSANAIRLDPAGLKSYARDRARLGRDEAAPDEPILIFFGDSRALMWPEPSTPTGYRVVNRGIGYQTTAQMLLRFDADVTALHPAVVVVEGGVNDLRTIVDFPERRAEIVADCETNLASIVDRCRQTGASVVVVTVFGIGDISVWRRPFWSSDVSAAVREVNAYLAKLAGGKVILFDTAPVLRDGTGEIARDYQIDHLHLSAAGYGALNRELGPLLSALPK